MNPSKNEQTEPNIQILTNRKQIQATIRKLKLRDLLSEVIQKIHVWVEREPHKAHLATVLDTDGTQTLLVGSVFRNSLFGDFGILTDADYRDPEVYDGLIRLSEQCAMSLGARMTKSCECAVCCAKRIREDLVQ
jgi:hypothetical protein